MKIAILTATMLVAGCATTPEGIQREAVVATHQSAKAPIEIAQCMKDLMPGLDVYPGADEISVSNKNQWGSILLNWRIIKTATGSTIEVRKTNSIAPGMALATRCF